MWLVSHVQSVKVNFDSSCEISQTIFTRTNQFFHQKLCCQKIVHNVNNSWSLWFTIVIICQITQQQHLFHQRLDFILYFKTNTRCCLYYLWDNAVHLFIALIFKSGSLHRCVFFCVLYWFSVNLVLCMESLCDPWSIFRSFFPEVSSNLYKTCCHSCMRIWFIVWWTDRTHTQFYMILVGLYVPRCVWRTDDEYKTSVTSLCFALFITSIIWTLDEFCKDDDVRPLVNLK